MRSANIPPNTTPAMVKNEMPRTNVLRSSAVRAAQVIVRSPALLCCASMTGRKAEVLRVVHCACVRFLFERCGNFQIQSELLKSRAEQQPCTWRSRQRKSYQRPHRRRRPIQSGAETTAIATSTVRNTRPDSLVAINATNKNPAKKPMKVTGSPYPVVVPGSSIEVVGGGLAFAIRPPAKSAPAPHW